MRPQHGTEPRPALLQALFVTVYTSAWFTTVIIPGLGRPERILAILGLVAVPFTLGANTRISIVPPPMVSVGIIGMLATYVGAYLANPAAPDGIDYLLALAGRVTFLWLAFVHLQSRELLRRAVGLIIFSSLAAAAFAVLVMLQFGLGAGRTQYDQLHATLGSGVVEIFAAAQWATMGAILLLGVAPRFQARWRRLAVPAAILVFSVAYLTYFRRQFLISGPVVLASMLLLQRSRKSSIAVVALAFVALVGWEYTRDDSILRVRLAQEAGGALVDTNETRLTTSYAQWQAFQERPIAGYGPGNHAVTLAPLVPLDERFLSGFNIYGWLAVEGGLGCVTFYLVAVLGVVRAAWSKRNARDASVIGSVVLCGPVLVLQVLIWGLFGNAWESPLAWFIMGMILAATQISKAHAPSPSVIAPVYRASVTRTARPRMSFAPGGAERQR